MPFVSYTILTSRSSFDSTLQTGKWVSHFPIENREVKGRAIYEALPLKCLFLSIPPLATWPSFLPFSRCPFPRLRNHAEGWKSPKAICRGALWQIVRYIWRSVAALCMHKAQFLLYIDVRSARVYTQGVSKIGIKHWVYVRGAC